VEIGDAERDGGEAAVDDDTSGAGVSCEQTVCDQKLDF